MANLLSGYLLMNENIPFYDLEVISSSHDRNSWLHLAGYVMDLEYCFNNGCLKWKLLAQFITIKLTPNPFKLLLVFSSSFAQYPSVFPV